MQVNKPQETDDDTRVPACMVLEFHNKINAQNSNIRFKIILFFFRIPLIRQTQNGYVRCFVFVKILAQHSWTEAAANAPIKKEKHEPKPEHEKSY